MGSWLDTLKAKEMAGAEIELNPGLLLEERCSSPTVNLRTAPSVARRYKVVLADGNPDY